MNVAVRARRMAVPDPAAANRADTRFAYLAFAFFMAVNFARPQDMLTPIGLLMPGALATAALAIAALAKFGRVRWNDRVLQLYAAFIFVCCIGVINVVNHFHWMQAVQSLAISFLAFAMVLPIAASTPEGRLKIMRWIVASHLVIAIWALTHSGQGQGAFVGDENDCALGLAVGTAYCFFLARAERSRFWRISSAVAFVVCLAGIVATESRGGFLGLAAVLLSIAIFSRALFKTAAIIAVVVVVSLPFIPSAYLADIESINDKDDGTRVERLYSWGLGIRMYKEYPVLGIGAANYPWRVGEFEPPQNERPNPMARSLATRVAHSLYFTLIPETGTLGVLVFLSLVIIALRRCWRAIRALDPQDEANRIPLAWCQGTAAAMAAFLVACTFVSTLYYPYFWLLISMTIIMPDFVTKSVPAAPSGAEPQLNHRAGRRPARPRLALTPPRRDT